MGHGRGEGVQGRVGEGIEGSQLLVGTERVVRRLLRLLQPRLGHVWPCTPRSLPPVGPGRTFSRATQVLGPTACPQHTEARDAIAAPEEKAVQY